MFPLVTIPLFFVFFLAFLWVTWTFFKDYIIIDSFFECISVIFIVVFQTLRIYMYNLLRVSALRTYIMTHLFGKWRISLGLLSPFTVSKISLLFLYEKGWVLLISLLLLEFHTQFFKKTKQTKKKKTSLLMSIFYCFRV